MWLAVLLLESEREELLVVLDRCLGPRAPDETLDVKDSVLRVQCELQGWGEEREEAGE